MRLVTQRHGIFWLCFHGILHGRVASVRTMICRWLLLLLLAFSSHLSQSCTVQYTRRKMERKLTRGSRRGARTLNDTDKEQERRHLPGNFDPDSCLALMFSNHLGKIGGAPEATTCERGFGLYPSLENLQSPYSWYFGFVNTCENQCLQRPECEYYVYDCKLSLCELKMGSIDQNSFVNNTRYITGKKTSREPGECKNETTAGAL